VPNEGKVSSSSTGSTASGVSLLSFKDSGSSM
jgi:hypothetical protein